MGFMLCLVQDIQPQFDSNKGQFSGAFAAVQSLQGEIGLNNAMVAEHNNTALDATVRYLHPSQSSAIDQSLVAESAGCSNSYK